MLGMIHGGVVTPPMPSIEAGGWRFRNFRDLLVNSNIFLALHLHIVLPLDRYVPAQYTCNTMDISDISIVLITFIVQSHVVLRSRCQDVVAARQRNTGEHTF